MPSYYIKLLYESIFQLLYKICPWGIYCTLVYTLTSKHFRDQISFSPHHRDDYKYVSYLTLGLKKRKRLLLYFMVFKCLSYTVIIFRMDPANCPFFTTKGHGFNKTLKAKTLLKRFLYLQTWNYTTSRIICFREKLHWAFFICSYFFFIFIHNDHTVDLSYCLLLVCHWIIMFYGAVFYNYGVQTEATRKTTESNAVLPLGGRTVKKEMFNKTISLLCPVMAW